MSKPRLLIIGDFACFTGFARVNEAIAVHLSDRWNIAVLGVNYKGDHCEQQQHYRLYPALLGGDLHGVGRLSDIIRVEQPQACLFTCDPWIGADYARALQGIGNRGQGIGNMGQGTDPLRDSVPYSLSPVASLAPPAVLYTPVDATGLRRVDIEPLNQFESIVSYTRFGAGELRRSGYTGPMAIIPHGIDLELFRPIEQRAAREAVGLPLETFAVLVLDQNNPRKRLDIAFDAFARFAQDKPGNVKLVYHGPLGGQGRWDILGMADDLGIGERLVLPRQDGLAIPHDQLAYLYSMCDVKISTTSGEGWGMTTNEAMACGLPCVAPDFAALGEWAWDAIYRIPAVTPLRHVEINTVGRSPTPEAAAAALEDIYRYPEQREALREAGLALVKRPEYQWSRIADQFHAVLLGAMMRHANETAVVGREAVLA